MASRLILSGLRSIEECIRVNPDRVARILVPPGRPSGRIERICQLAREAGIRLENNPKLDHSAEEGLLALMNDYEYADPTALLQEVGARVQEGERPVLLAVDGITDPQNLGAIFRTAAFMGVAGVLLPKDRSATINETVYRVASGGLEYLKVAHVTNLVSAMAEAKEAGFWTVGFSEHAEKSLAEVQADFPPLIVIGNEEKGIRQLVKQNCDFLVRLDSRTPLQSLNASVAAALAMAWATGTFRPQSE